MYPTKSGRGADNPRSRQKISGLTYGLEGWLPFGGRAVLAVVLGLLAAGPFACTNETSPRSARPPADHAPAPSSNQSGAESADVPSDPAVSLPDSAAPSPKPATPVPEPPALPRRTVGESPERTPEATESGPALREAVEALEREALDAVGQLIEALPMSSDPLALMGMVHVMFGNTAEGMQWWERSLEKDPKRPDVCDGMAEIALQRGKYDKAVQWWGKVLEISPASRGIRNKIARALVESGKMREAVAVLEKEMEISPEQRSLSYYLMGKAYLQLREYEKARESYEAAVEIRPDYSGAWYGLATACARLGQSEKARQFMQKFQTLKTADRDAETGRKRSRRDLASVRRLVARAHTSVGVTYHAKRYLRRAEQHWLRAAELDPEDAACRMQLASLYRNGGKYEKALPICEKLVQIDPTNAVFHVNLGILYRQMNRIDAALAEVQRAIDLEPDYAEYRRIYQRIQEKK